jgi:hypothetical protein
LGPTLADGFYGYGSFTGNYGEQRSSFFAVDISGVQAPEPGTVFLAALGVFLLCLWQRRPETRFPPTEPHESSGD